MRFLLVLKHAHPARAPQESAVLGLRERRITSWFVITVVLGLLVVGSAARPATAAPSKRVKNGPITFAVLADQPADIPPVASILVDDYDIFMVNPDGTGLQALRQGPAADFEPAWSPDGTKLAFASSPRFAFAADIYVMNSDGTRLTNITNSPQNDDLHPSWSPDGSRIVYSSELSPLPVLPAGRGPDIHVMNVDGTNDQVIYERLGSQYHPAWSPRGDWIAFVENGSPSVQLISPDGRHFRRLRPTNVNGRPLRPEWSPDGRWIAFADGIVDATGEQRGYDLYVTSLDDLRPRNLTPGTDENDLAPAWAPDGTKIAFLSDRSGPLQLYVMNPDGSGVRRIVDLDLKGSAPHWGPRP
ncbi:MAG: hypothetical protein ABR505_02055 [Actinomycetota bacterium]